MMLIRRTPRKFTGFTDAQGYKKPSAGPLWPFGMDPNAGEQQARKARIKAILKSMTKD